MRNFFLGLLTILSVLLTHGGAGAATIYVPGSYASIQAALDAAGANDTVIVKGGEYAENIVIRKPVTLISELGPAKTTVKAAVDGEPVIMIDGAKDVTLPSKRLRRLPLGACRGWARGRVRTASGPRQGACSGRYPGISE